MWYDDLLPDIFAEGLFALMILNAAYLRGGMRRALNGRVLTYLGDISYSIYMVHIPLIITLFVLGTISGGEAGPTVESDTTPVAVNYLQNWIGALIGALIVIGVASLTYRFIEKPMRARLKGGRSATAEPAPAPANR